jgi:hypothetical protein
MKIEDILENSSKRKTQTKPDIGQADFQPQQYDPIEPYNAHRERQQSQTSNNIQQRVASQGQTLQATSGLGSEEMARMLSRMRDIDADVDDVGYEREPTTDISRRVTTDNLPAVAGANLQAAGFQNPEWHKVSNLPGNMKQAIRTLGKRLFGAMTNTPTDEIFMIANLGGRGPNTQQEVNAVVNFMQQYGKDLGSGDIDFDTVIPGYTADIHQYSAGGIRWLLVQDQFGRYIYSWPEKDSISHVAGQQLTNKDR